VEAIADSIEDEVRKGMNIKPWHVEGYENKEWILMDYIDTVVHVFQPEIREFYAIEDLWADAVLKKHVALATS
jgi:ribosome-associated protein